eukprot:5555432-Prymnesium_polylepis.1
MTRTTLVPRSARGRALFERKISPSLWLSAQIGHTSSSTAFIQLSALLMPATDGGVLAPMGAAHTSDAKRSILLS